MNKRLILILMILPALSMADEPELPTAENISYDRTLYKNLFKKMHAWGYDGGSPLYSPSFDPTSYAIVDDGDHKLRMRGIIDTIAPAAMAQEYKAGILTEGGAHNIARIIWNYETNYFHDVVNISLSSSNDTGYISTERLYDTKRRWYTSLYNQITYNLTETELIPLRKADNISDLGLTQYASIGIRKPTAELKYEPYFGDPTEAEKENLVLIDNAWYIPSAFSFIRYELTDEEYAKWEVFLENDAPMIVISAGNDSVPSNYSAALGSSASNGFAAEFLSSKLFGNRTFIIGAVGGQHSGEVGLVGPAFYSLLDSSNLCAGPFFTTNCPGLASYSNEAGEMANWFVVSMVTRSGGTSEATAAVSGALLLLSQRYSSASAQERAKIAFRTTSEYGEKGTDLIYGRGMINPYTFLKSQHR